MNSLKNNDALKEFVKGKLADYKGEVPAQGWERLEEALVGTHKAKVAQRSWIASTVAAVAAAVVGVFFLMPTQQREEATHALQEITTERKDVKNIEKPKVELLTDNALLTNESKQAVNRNVIYKESTVDDVKKDAEEKGMHHAVPTVEDVTAREEKRQEADGAREEREMKQREAERVLSAEREDSAMEGAATTTKRKSKRHAISLTGNSGVASSQQSNALPMTLRSSVSEVYSDFTMSKMMAHNEEEKVEPRSEMTHKQPVSIGAVVALGVTERLQIETGLVYTYLSSETKNISSDFNNSEKVQFHYLGVPVNVNYTLWSKNRVNLFATAGAMIEKDIAGKIKYNDEKDASKLNSGYANKKSSSINQKNPQLSVSAGLGVNYPIHDKASMFGRIGGRYYIDAKNEYKTYYSDEKFGMDIEVGIKFNF